MNTVMIAIPVITVESRQLGPSVCIYVTHESFTAGQTNVANVFTLFMELLTCI